MNWYEGFRSVRAALMKVERGLAVVSEAVGTIALAFTVGAVGLGVLSRQFQLGASWSFELSSFAFVWLTFLGALAAEARSANIAITFFDQRLGPSGLKMFAAVRYVITLVVALVLMRSALVHANFSLGTSSPVAGWPMVAVTSSVVVLAVGIAVLTILRLAGLLFGQQPEPPQLEETPEGTNDVLAAAHPGGSA